MIGVTPERAMKEKGHVYVILICFFFFQAEDGIRDLTVTGVQTCALPILVLDVASGEVLAMVNQPAYNPNDRDQILPATYRNRAATDIFEPGSSIKPFFEIGRAHV